MTPRVTSVRANPDYSLSLTFTNGEMRRFDVHPYLERGFFRELQSPGYFNAVRTFLGSVQWPNGQDFCPDTLYLQSKKIEETTNDERRTTNEERAPHS